MNIPLLTTILLFSYCTTFAQFGGLFDALKEAAEPAKKKSSPKQSGLLNIPNQTTKEDVLKNDIDHIYTWIFLETHRDPFGNETLHPYTFKGKFIGIWTDYSGNSLGVQFKDTTFVDKPRYNAWRPDGKGGHIACLKNGEKLKWEQLSADNQDLIEWCKEKREKHENDIKIAAEKLAQKQKAEAKRKEIEAAQQRELTLSKLEKDFPRVKELGDSMKGKTFVFKSIYLGMPVWDAKSALLATGVGDVQENDKNQTFIKGKIVVEDRTVSHDVISSLKSTKPSPPFGASNQEKLRIQTRYTTSKIMACNGVSKGGLFSGDCPPSDGKIDVIEIYEDGLKALFKFDDDIDLSTLVKIISEVYDIDFITYSNIIMTAHIHIDYDKGFVLRLMSNGGQLSFKLLKIPSVSEIKMAKQAAEEATKKKIESARSAFD
jgi:hypothetical protein